MLILLAMDLLEYLCEACQEKLQGVVFPSNIDGERSLEEPIADNTPTLDMPPTVESQLAVDISITEQAIVLQSRMNIYATPPPGGSSTAVAHDPYKTPKFTGQFTSIKAKKAASRAAQAVSNIPRAKSIKEHCLVSNAVGKNANLQYCHVIPRWMQKQKAMVCSVHF